MRTLRTGLAAAGTAALLTLAGCTSSGDAADKSAPAASSSSTPPAEVGAATIRDVWDKIGCTDLSDDPAGSRGLIDAPGSSLGPPVVHNGWCYPYGGAGEMTFFFQFADYDTAVEWLVSGGLEIGPTDTVFIDGAVIVLARDAATAQMLAPVLTPPE